MNEISDVYLPCWTLGKPAALDFAVTSGLRLGEISNSLRDRSTACADYESRKRSFLDTEALCKQEGITFVPMVVEASGGGWGAEARGLFKEVAKTSARLTGDPPSVKQEQLLQSLSVCFHRGNARAILRRAPAIPSARSAMALAQAALARAQAENSAGPMCIDQDRSCLLSV